jgi:hypothetical protein
MRASKNRRYHRGLGKAQKIRMRLGANANMLEDFPDKPKGMHWQTHDRQRRAYDAAEERSTIGLSDLLIDWAVDHLSTAGADIRKSGMTDVTPSEQSNKAEGYDVTRFNALRHDVLSRYTLLPWEDAE